ncbi:3'5'-cyclic nucleotide phosphodiesterase domain-containing protein, partial [Toxoplasma gondii TgCatPRC2]
ILFVAPSSVASRRCSRPSLETELRSSERT